MYNVDRGYSNPYGGNTPWNFFGYMYNPYHGYQYPYQDKVPINNPEHSNPYIELKDYGNQPFVVDIEKVTKQNNTFRTALWTGKHLQLTLMSIRVGEDIGLEVHPNLDQFVRIEEGRGLVKMGDRKDKLDYQKEVYDDFAFIIPAGKWHNLINTGQKPIKLYSIYAPPEHPYGTVHNTKADSEADDHNH